MGWHGYWASPGDWQTHHSQHPGHQRNSFPVSTPVHSSVWECGLLPQHNEHRIRSRRSRCFCLVFTPAALCWWAKKNNNAISLCSLLIWKRLRVLRRLTSLTRHHVSSKNTRTNKSSPTVMTLMYSQLSTTQIIHSQNSRTQRYPSSVSSSSSGGSDSVRWSNSSRTCE